MLRRLVLALSLALALATPLACKKTGDAATQAAAEPPRVDDQTTGLLLTWIDDKGEFHIEQKVADVPAEARETVRVRDPAKDEPSDGRVFVADLRALGAGGTYAVRLVPRDEFENVAVARRAKNGAVLAPHAPAGPPSAGSTADVASRPAVIIYGASWCGPCHQAEAYLKQRGVTYVEHDIEKDSLAAHEMQSKLAKAGMRGGSIPVLDVRGRILVGFDPRAVDGALAAAGP